MRARVILMSVLTLVTFSSGIPSSAAGEKAVMLPFSFLVADIDTRRVATYGRDGKVTWVYGGVKPLDARPLKDGDVLMAYPPSKLTDNRGGVRIVNAKKTIRVVEFDDNGNRVWELAAACM